GTDFALENQGGVRSPIVRGPITRADLIALDPFGNTVVLFKATGRQVRSLLERHAPAVSGIRYRLVGRVLTEVTINGEPLDEDRVYSGVTNSYLAGFALKGLKFEDTGRKRLDTVMAYIRKHGTIQPSYDGRRLVVRE
ncbi:MAG: hypothetical protein EHM13_01665, partial [Acidobacteria bacterium]